MKSSQIPRSGHRLTLKKGRRSRNRFENERALFASTIGEEFDPDEAFGGKDIVPDTGSLFRTLFEDGNRKGFMCGDWRQRGSKVR